MSAIPLICVEKVPQTSELLQSIFGWKSNHGGEEFEDLIDAKGRSTVWLHRLADNHHPRFEGIQDQPKGAGVAIYGVVADVEKTYHHAQALGCFILEPLEWNPNAHFREFSFRLPEGYVFSVCERGPYLSI